MLLAYYIALINITQAAQNRDSSLKNFKNIALTDSLDFYEEKNDKGVFDLFKDLEENKEIKSTIEKQNIRVIIGNPPYSADAKKAKTITIKTFHTLSLKKGLMKNTAKIPPPKWGQPHETRSFKASTWQANFLKIKGC
ncbi:hypothetical protein [Helicobacter pylori]